VVGSVGSAARFRLPLYRHPCPGLGEGEADQAARRGSDVNSGSLTPADARRPTRPRYPAGREARDFLCAGASSPASGLLLPALAASRRGQASGARSGGAGRDRDTGPSHNSIAASGVAPVQRRHRGDRGAHQGGRGQGGRVAPVRRKAGFWCYHPPRGTVRRGRGWVTPALPMDSPDLRTST